jgi:hypothetical protein
MLKPSFPGMKERCHKLRALNPQVLSLFVPTVVNAVDETAYRSDLARQLVVVLDR